MASLPDWMIVTLTMIYTANIGLACMGYLPQITRLLGLYRNNAGVREVPWVTYLLWSIGSLSTTLFGVFIAQQWEMVLVGGSTLILNMVTLLLVALVHFKAR